MIVSVNPLNTIQFSQQELIIPITSVCNTELCAMHLVYKHFSEVKAWDSYPAF